MHRIAMFFSLLMPPIVGRLDSRDRCARCLAWGTGTNLPIRALVAAGGSIAAYATRYRTQDPAHHRARPYAGRHRLPRGPARDAHATHRGPDRTSEEGPAQTR